MINKFGACLGFKRRLINMTGDFASHPSTYNDLSASQGTLVKNSLPNIHPKTVTISTMVACLLLANPVANAGDLDATADFGAAGLLSIPKAGADKSKGKPADGMNFNPADLSVLNHESILNGRTGTVLENVSNQRVTTTRGAKEAQIYQQYARSVVLIVTDDGMGSGVLIEQSGLILTNWHVVGNNKQVGVVFKPKVEGQAPKKADIRRGQVVRFDQIADLALVKVSEVPAGIEPMPLGEMSEVAVGNDVHAIGHPTGEAWTYTKGFVSQIRNDYKWSGGQQQVAHQANVIQTQTPINPGNSGGPLISAEGRLVGINSFKSSGEALNFAVAVNDVKRFVESKQNRLAKAAEPRPTKANVGTECKAKVIERSDSEDGSSQVTVIDARCDGKPSAVLVTPYDIRKPITLSIDQTGSGKVTGKFIDMDRDGKWDASAWDTKGKGDWDVVCSQVNGTLEVDRCEPYKKKS